MLAPADGLQSLPVARAAFAVDAQSGAVCQIACATYASRSGCEHVLHQCSEGLIGGIAIVDGIAEAPVAAMAACHTAATSAALSRDDGVALQEGSHGRPKDHSKAGASTARSSAPAHAAIAAAPTVAAVVGSCGACTAI